MKLIIIALLLIPFMAIYVGCAGRKPITPQIDVFEYPPLNVAQRSELGNTIATKAKLYSYEILELLTEADCHFIGMQVMTILPGILKAQFEDERGIYFYADNFKNGTNAYYTNAGIFIPKNDASEHFAFAEKGSPNSLTILSCDNLDFRKTKINEPGKFTFQQELIYNGRHENNINFIYRELSNDIKKPAFSRDILYDLKKGNIAELKGVRIEIFEASDNYIEYKILHSFPDSNL